MARAAKVEGPSPDRKTTPPRQNVRDGLFEILQLAEEADTVAVLVGAYAEGSGPPLLYPTARLLRRLATRLTEVVCGLIERDEEARDRRRG